jgi:ATP-binding cassette subfamily B protein
MGEPTSITIEDLDFTYPGVGSDPVLKNINLEIPARKLTAIVGMSGSGKTTLLKLMLNFFDRYKGSIRVGNYDLRTIKPSYWRSITGSVLQDGFIFNDTIAGNIALADQEPDQKRLIQAARVAEIYDFIKSLPLGFQTKIGSEGSGISAGQQQRLLIARAVYKDPSFLFFDEATNALDANNETAIVENLRDFFTGRTVIVAAHRLSTIMNADKIVVIDKGRIVEEGTHDELIRNHAGYYELVKNQLELEV